MSETEGIFYSQTAEPQLSNLQTVHLPAPLTRWTRIGSLSLIEAAAQKNFQKVAETKRPADDKT